MPVRRAAGVRRPPGSRRGRGLSATDTLSRRIASALDQAFLQETLLELARFPTNVPLGFDTLMEPDHPRLVRYVQDVVRPRLVTEGADDLLDVGRNNLVVRVGSGESDDVLLIQSYTVAQHHNLMERPFEPRIVQGAPYGRDEPVVVAQGVSQCKGHQAVMLAVLRLLRELGTPLRGRLYWSVNNEGRSTHDCTFAILDSLDPKPQFAILQLGDGMRISLGNRGRVDVDVTIEGRTTHSSTPEDGLSAIDAVADAVRRLKALRWTDEHPVLGARHAHVYKLDVQPVAPHTLPGHARITVDRRLLPGDDPDAASAEVAQALTGMDPFAVNVERGVTMLPSLVDPSEPWLRSLRQAVAATRGEPAPEVVDRGCFDAGGTSSRGVPTVSFGAGGDGDWPAGDDVVALSDVEDEARALAHLILTRLA